MKDYLKRIGLWLSPRVDQVHYYCDYFNWKKIDQTAAIHRQTQILLALQYQGLVRSGAGLPRFEDVEFRSYSQHGEDGILLFIFSIIGTTNKRVVEVCAGDGVECNAANLIVNHHWTGLLFDGDAAKINFGRAYYARNLGTLPRPPKLVQAWIDAEGVNSLISRNGMEGEIDLLSLDMDGVDYWVLNSITCIKPRVIVLEYNAGLGPNEARTVPYSCDFRSRGKHWGASLPAFVKLCGQRGYRLVGCDMSGVNAFFIRSGIAEQAFPEVTMELCFQHSRACDMVVPDALLRADGEWAIV